MDLPLDIQPWGEETVLMSTWGDRKSMNKMYGGTQNTPARRTANANRMARDRKDEAHHSKGSMPKQTGKGKRT